MEKRKACLANMSSTVQLKCADQSIQDHALPEDSPSEEALELQGAAPAERSICSESRDKAAHEELRLQPLSDFRRRSSGDIALAFGHFFATEFIILFSALFGLSYWPEFWRLLQLSPLQSEASLIAQSACALALYVASLALIVTAMAFYMPPVMRVFSKHKSTERAFQLNASKETTMSAVLNGLALLPSIRLKTVNTAAGIIEAESCRSAGWFRIAPTLQISVTVKEVRGECMLLLTSDVVGNITCRSGYYRLSLIWASQQAALLDEAVGAIESALRLNIHAEQIISSVSDMRKKSNAYLLDSLKAVTAMALIVGASTFAWSQVFASHSLQHQSVEFFLNEKPELALQYAERAVATDPLCDYAQGQKAQCLIALGRFPEALIASEAACTLDKDKSIESRELKSDVLARLGRFEEADEIYAQILDDERINVDQKTNALNNLAWSNALHGRENVAIDQINKAIVLAPSMKCLYGVRGLARAQQGDLLSAVADQSTAISLAEKQAPCTAATNYFMRSDAYRSMGQLVAADQDLKKALELGGSREKVFRSKFLMPPTKFKMQANQAK